MSADISITVQVFDRHHGWIELPESLTLGTADQRLACDPEDRDARVHAIFGRHPSLDVTRAAFAYRGPPPGLSPDHPHHTMIGATWATVTELRAIDWRADLWRGQASQFETWLRRGVLDRIAVAYGPDNVRVLAGFDS